MFACIYIYMCIHIYICTYIFIYISVANLAQAQALGLCPVAPSEAAIRMENLASGTAIGAKSGMELGLGGMGLPPNPPNPDAGSDRLSKR